MRQRRRLRSHLVREQIGLQLQQKAKVLEVSDDEVEVMIKAPVATARRARRSKTTPPWRSVGEDKEETHNEMTNKKDVEHEHKDHEKRDDGKSSTIERPDATPWQMPSLTPQAAATPIAVEIFTCGYQTIGCKFWLQDTTKERMVGPGNVLEMLTLYMGKDYAIDAPFDCSIFTRTTRTRNHAYNEQHVGENYHIQRGVVDHDYFDTFMKKVKGTIMQLASHKHELKILFICPRGIKRSVACARLAKVCLGESERFRVAEIVHLTKQNWKGKCYRCVACDDYNMHQKKETVFADAIKVWGKA